MVKTDLETVKLQAKKIEDFADKRIAYHDKKKPKKLPTFTEVDDCINLLDQLYVKYHLAFHSSSMESLMPTYQYNWKAIFQSSMDSKKKIKVLEFNMLQAMCDNPVLIFVLSISAARA